MKFFKFLFCCFCFTVVSLENSSAQSVSVTTFRGLTNGTALVPSGANGLAFVDVSIVNSYDLLDPRAETMIIEIEVECLPFGSSSGRYSIVLEREEAERPSHVRRRVVAGKKATFVGGFDIDCPEISIPMDILVNWSYSFSGGKPSVNLNVNLSGALGGQQYPISF